MEGINNEKYNKKLWIKIKSKYILRQIFNNLKQSKLLELIRYNKIIKNVLDKRKKDYIDEYLKIEIEIIPLENKYGRFINIKDNYKPYIHIYFIDKNGETKRNYINNGEKVSKIKIIIDNEVKSFTRLFQECKCIKIINFIKFNKNDINNMSYMFYNCSSLKELNLNNFNTNNVTDMSCMFCGCLNELRVKIKSQFKNFKEEAFLKLNIY